MEASLFSEFYPMASDTLMEERDNSSDNSGDNSPSSTTLSSPKRSRRGMQKRVMMVPIKDVEGCNRLKGDFTPPSDSWAWRKYGQKPIKGSPYPRGYYRCSSSKGCPARKQVERSNSDPKMLVVTYSYDHNHPWPTSKNHHKNRYNATTTTTVATTQPPPTTTTTTTTTTATTTAHDQTILEENIIDHHQTQPRSDGSHHEPLITTDELAWFSLDRQILDDNFLFNNSNMIMREEDESLFADLGELPECSVVFRRASVVAAGEEQRRCSLTSWCGTTG